MQGPRLIFYTAVRRAQIRKGVGKLAATRLIALHQNKGKSVAACLKSRTDYAQNPEKTDGGALVSSYGCSPLTVDEEFLLSKRQYEQSTGRSQKNNVIAYQIRQSFKPGEITPEEANKVGYELAMRWTKGKYQFFVCSVLIPTASTSTTTSFIIPPPWTAVGSSGTSGCRGWQCSGSAM